MPWHLCFDAVRTVLITLVYVHFLLVKYIYLEEAERYAETKKSADFAKTADVRFPRSRLLFGKEIMKKLF